MSSERMSQLAGIISSNTKRVEKYLSDNGLPLPSIGINGPSQIPIEDGDVAAARSTVMGAIQELKCLMLGPIATLMSIEV